MPAFHSVGIVANLQRPDVPATVETAVQWLRRRGIRVQADPAAHEQLDLSIPAFSWEGLASQVDLLLTFGGDGTILFAARRLAGQPIPIFGVNTGSLGFLTSSSRDAMTASFEVLFEGGGEVESTLTVRSELLAAGAGEGEGESQAFTALNDVVIHKGAVTARVVDLRLEVDGDEVGTYVADGLILATPLGSTGYALSAQGPLVVPTVDAIVATPICPHTLAIRPLVLPAHARIRVEVVGLQEAATLAVDGIVVGELRQGDVVTATRGEEPVRLIRLPENSFFRLLRSKLHWGGRASRT